MTLPVIRPPGALQQRAESLRDEDAKNARARLADNTHRAYDHHWKRFGDWCLQHGHRSTIPVSPATLLEYITELGLEGKSLSTIRTTMAAVAREHVNVGSHQSPTASPLIRDRIAGLARRRAASRKNSVVKAGVMTLNHLRALTDVECGQSAAMRYRDRALLLLGFSGGLRRSELVGLDLADIRPAGDGSLDLYLHRSKTDQTGAGQSVPVYPSRDPAVCPVRAYNLWRQQHTAAVGPAFVAIHKHGQPMPHRRLSAQTVARIVKAAMARLGIVDGRWSGHSLRRGCVTNAVACDIPLLEIAEHVRHQSMQTTRGYVGSRSNKGMRRAMNKGRE